MKILISAALFFSLAGAGVAQEAKPAAPEAWKTRTFTLEELKKYDGKDGRPAYAAVDGIVYDLTKSGYWKGGTHMKMHGAGADLTKDIKERAPQHIHNGGKILEKMPKVGVLATQPPVAAEAAPAPLIKGVSAHKIGPEELGKEVRCAVTRKPVKVTEKTPALDYKGKVYYFASSPLLEKFSKNPEKYLGGLEKAADLLKKKG